MQGSFQSVRTDETNPLWETCVAREQALYGRNNDIRSEFERDYTRLLHCEAYRRLKHKTQVFFAPHNDHVCTRMEHVSHVASVASTVAKYLGLNDQLASAIALGHDIGHAPFGHYGEECLNSLLEQKPGKNAPKKFWHERNSLFFADYIETLQDTEGAARHLDLTYAVRDGIVCHCGEIDESGIRPRTNPLDLYTIRRAGSAQPFTWEGCVVKLADKIAYLGRDIEDAREYHILDMGAYRQLREIVASCFGFKTGKTVNTTVLINDLIVDLCSRSSPETGLCFSPENYRFITEIKRFNYENIYSHWRLREFQSYAANIIRTICSTLRRAYPAARTRKIPFALKQFPVLCRTFENWLVKYTQYDEERKHVLKYDGVRTVFDLANEESYDKCIIEYLSGMTDQFAICVYEEIISF
ncbi:deoxyguanosinetriphosphate triphosphohydrolase family protein [Treponema brennaborense]|uniref:Metal-dependent phosphohydrolase HD sub domain protein n=1 Tax=Treponema brennaborense (strain DSM 12168 / CIP 105900 / DD5/3) TaxID=906968 RepID=F4LP69_TREBD|nr:HD domain-containing protein [Treponema brennaborense]AEE15945.1 metal-dependent phosphohydrolase HD sub domain protein [Treponema brennaborense DSM 12168]